MPSSRRTNLNGCTAWDSRCQGTWRQRAQAGSFFGLEDYVERAQHNWRVESVGCHDYSDALVVIRAAARSRRAFRVIDPCDEPIDRAAHTNARVRSRDRVTPSASSERALA